MQSLSLSIYSIVTGSALQLIDPGVEKPDPATDRELPNYGVAVNLSLPAFNIAVNRAFRAG
jgi:hypothetical protein